MELIVVCCTLYVVCVLCLVNLLLCFPVCFFLAVSITGPIAFCLKQSETNKINRGSNETVLYIFLRCLLEFEFPIITPLLIQEAVTIINVQL